MPARTEEIKVIVSASSGELRRELTAAEKAMLQARGVIQDASGKIRASSKAWTQYRNAAVNEMNAALAGVRKAQEKISALKAKMKLDPADEKIYVNASAEMGSTPQQINDMLADMRTGMLTKEERQEYTNAAADLEAYRAAADDARRSIEYLNGEVAQSAEAEKTATQQAKEATRAERERAMATRNTAREDSIS